MIVIHGIDCDGSGIYSGVLERSEIDKQVPATATAPALCGVLAPPASAASGRAAGIYTARLLSYPAIPGIPASLLVCHLPAATSPVGRRGAAATA